MPLQRGCKASSKPDCKLPEKPHGSATEARWLGHPSFDGKKETLAWKTDPITNVQKHLTRAMVAFCPANMRSSIGSTSLSPLTFSPSSPFSPFSPLSHHKHTSRIHGHYYTADGIIVMSKHVETQRGSNKEGALTTSSFHTCIELARRSKAQSKKHQANISIYSIPSQYRAWLAGSCAWKSESARPVSIKWRRVRAVRYQGRNANQTLVDVTAVPPSSTPLMFLSIAQNLP